MLAGQRAENSKVAIRRSFRSIKFVNFYRTQNEHNEILIVRFGIGNEHDIYVDEKEVYKLLVTRE